MVSNFFLFVVNPAAGKGKAMELVTRIQQAAEKAGITYEIYVTKSKEDGIAYVRSACALHPQIRLYACGGDGTLNDLVSAAAGFENAEIGMIPCGTGNDFIKCLGENLDFLDFEKQIYGKTKPIDLISIGKELTSINITNIGLDADAAYYMNRIKKLPLMVGSLPYYLGVLTSLLKRMGKHLTLKLDGQEELSGCFLLTAICNGQVYGGGYHAAPLAEPDDGLLDVCLVKKMSKLQIIKMIGIYKKGQHLDSPQLKPYILYRKCRKAELITKDPIRLCIDGEIVMTPSTVFEVNKGVVRFIIPEGDHYFPSQQPHNSAIQSI